MKAYSKTLIVTLALLTMLFAGCGGKIKYPAYYELHVAPATDIPPKADHLPSIAVREFRAPGYLRQGPIVYRTSPEEVGYYEYHRWAVDPRSAITNAVVGRLRASGHFAAVTVYDGRAIADYILSGRLEKLEELDYA